MKRYILVLMSVLSFSGIGFAQQIGPGVPVSNLPGNMVTPNLGVGYNYYQASYDDVDFEGNRIYAHLGAVFGDESTPPYEVFLRFGASSLEDDGNFDGGFEPMYAAGLKTLFYQGEVFGWGGVFQGLYIDSFDDKIPAVGQNIEVTIEQNWELELALPIHAEVSNFLLYLGPIAYASSSDVGATQVSPEEGDLDEDGHVGAFGGVALRAGNIALEIEAKYKSDLSVGGLVSFTF